MEHQHLSHHMGKPTICIGENKGADQLRSNCEADQHLCFRYSDSTIPLLLKSNFKLLALFCACTGRFVSDLFGNHIVGFPTRRLIFWCSKFICFVMVEIRREYLLSNPTVPEQAFGGHLPIFCVSSCQVLTTDSS